MNKWPMVPLGEIMEQVSRPEAVDATATYRMLGARWYALGLFMKDALTGTEIQASKVYRVVSGDFVYNRLFAWKGSFAVAGDDVDGCFVSNEFPCFAVNKERVHPSYLKWYFSREAAWNEALGLSTGGTPTSRNRLKESVFLQLSVPLPPLAEQQKLVKYLDTLSAKINETSSKTEEITQNGKYLLLSAFNHISKDATRRRLGDIAPLVRRPAVVDPFAEYPGVSVRSFGKGTFHNLPLHGSDITWEKPQLVHAGDILISNIKAWEGAIAVAQPVDDGRYGSHRYLTYVPIPCAVTPRYLCFYLLTAEGLYHVGEASPGSADRNRTTSAKGLLEIPVPVPEYQQQLWFSELFDKVEGIEKLHAQVNVERGVLLPAILNQLFNEQAAGGIL